MFICILIRVNVQNSEVLDFSLIEHFFCSFALKYVFVIIRVIVQNGKVLEFSSIEDYFVHLH